MHVYNPFFNTKTTISDVDQLADRLLALSDTDAQVINDLLNLTQQDASLLSKLNQQASLIDQQASLLTQQSKDIAELKTDVNHAQALANASSENLLINPRGKINQADESAGVLSAGVYFCDGWKAGENGAEVYRDADGFRLLSGSIIQLVPNIGEPNQTLRGNMTIVSGAPQIKVNGEMDTAQSDSAEYIQFEVSGDNSKFTKLVLAQSESLPFYRQVADELTPCLRFYEITTFGMGYELRGGKGADGTGPYAIRNIYFTHKHRDPAISIKSANHAGTGTYFANAQMVSKTSLSALFRSSGGFYITAEFVVDARP
ncbi:hypothetical protein [Vibrio pectenicida]|uniref:hypothetical protein n=2 Tax=Vibrio pectenicida TaxID=62763 RepID=UPI0030815B59